MPSRLISRLVRATALREGAGVTVQRTIGTPALRHLDPFLLLDHFSSDNPSEYIAGFPDHPHRGFITLTYMLDGHLLHQDSMGNRGDLRAGGVQWMKAASGVIHSEMPQQTDGLMRGFQLWINLPAREKMSDPEYLEFPAARLPLVESDDARVIVIGGDYAGKQGAIADPHTDLQYLDVRLAPTSVFRHKLGPALNVVLYLFEGTASIGDAELPTHTAAIFGLGSQIEARAGSTGARFILFAGRPLGEPIVQYGPFVMNSETEIRRAMEDYRRGELVQTKARVRSS